MILSTKSVWAQKANFCGRVVYKQGNEMPSPDATASKGVGKQSILYVCPLSSLAQTHTTGSFFAELPKKPIKKLKTAASGYFCAKLKKGSYSIFVAIKDGYYANIFDEKMNICPLVIDSKTENNLNIEVISSSSNDTHEN